MKVFLSLFVLFACGISVGYAATFNQICAQDTTMNCYDFDVDEYYSYDQLTECKNEPYLVNLPKFQGQAPRAYFTVKYSARAGCLYPIRTNETSVSGGHSLKLRYPAHTGSNPSGNFYTYPGRTNMNPNKNSYLDDHYLQVGRGGDLWVRFKVKFTEGLANLAKDADGRYYPILDDSIATGKLSTTKISTFEGPNADLGSTFTLGRASKLIQGYGVGHAGEEDFSGNKDQVGCTRASKGNFPDNQSPNGSEVVVPPCKKFLPNKWHTVQIHIRYASQSNVHDGITEIFIDDDPSPVIQATGISHEDNSSGVLVDQPYFEGPITGPSVGIFRVRFSLFTTHKWEDQVHDEQAMYVDDLVISKTKIPPLDEIVDNLSPASPDELTAD